jgi:hypothetical protein
MADNTPIDIIQSRDHGDDLEPRGLKEGRRGSAERNPAAAVQQEKPGDDVPPDGGYGWVCVASVFWINAHTWGINSVSIPPVSTITRCANASSRAMESSLPIISLTTYSPTRHHSCMHSLAA